MAGQLASSPVRWIAVERAATTTGRERLERPASAGGKGIVVAAGEELLQG